MPSDADAVYDLMLTYRPERQKELRLTELLPLFPNMNVKAAVETLVKKGKVRVRRFSDEMIINSACNEPYRYYVIEVFAQRLGADIFSTHVAIRHAVGRPSATHDFDYNIQGDFLRDEEILAARYRTADAAFTGGVEFGKKTIDREELRKQKPSSS
jgi:hypothetical protein